MPVTDPISERIIQRIESRLKLITVANGHPQSVEVHRSDETGEARSPANRDVAITIFVISDDEVRNAGEPGRDCFKMMVGFRATMRHSKDSALPLGTKQSRVRASIRQVLDADRTCNGLAAVATFVTSDDKLENRLPAADAVLEVIYFTARGNPYSQ